MRNKIRPLRKLKSPSTKKHWIYKKIDAYNDPVSTKNVTPTIKPKK